MAKYDELVGAGATRADAGGITANDTGLLDAVDLPIIVIGRDCRIARINRAATAVLGLTASSVGDSLGNTFAGVENFDKICARVLADGVPHGIDARDGDRSFLVRMAPYTGS